MHVIDHEPHSWFLLKAGGQLFLDVYCNHSAFGYSVMILLDDQEAAAYASQGALYLNQLAQAVQDVGPGRGYQLRDITASYGKADLAAIQQWQAEQKQPECTDSSLPAST